MICRFRSFERAINCMSLSSNVFVKGQSQTTLHRQPTVDRGKFRANENGTKVLLNAK